VSLADALDRAAEALPELADVIRPANGDSQRVLEGLDGKQVKSLLVWMLGESPDDGYQLATEWAEHDTGRAALGEIAEGELDKPGRKALRRVRHKLRSRGVELPEAPAAPRVVKLPDVEGELEGAFVSPLDPGGARVVVMVKSHPSGGARIFELVTDELLGIRRCEVYKASRGKARRFLKEATAGGSGAGVPVAPESARALVARVAAGQPTDRSLPRAFAEWRRQLTEAPEGTPTPGELAAAGLPEPTAKDEVHLLEMIEQMRVGPWPPPEQALRKTAEQLAEVKDSKIVVSGPARRERFDEILRDAAQHAYGEGFSSHTAARFEESAYVFWKSGREDEARACLAGARAFREQEAGSNAVARALLGRLLAPLLAAENETEDTESGSLVVKP
jgi:hypothetical protein